MHPIWDVCDKKTHYRKRPFFSYRKLRSYMKKTLRADRTAAVSTIDN